MENFNLVVGALIAVVLIVILVRVFSVEKNSPAERIARLEREKADVVKRLREEGRMSSSEIKGIQRRYDNEINSIMRWRGGDDDDDERREEEEERRADMEESMRRSGVDDNQIRRVIEDDMRRSGEPEEEIMRRIEERPNNFSMVGGGRALGRSGNGVSVAERFLQTARRDEPGPLEKAAAQAVRFVRGER